jgi:RNA polymerase sigma-70 factor, ECF subfamily
MAVAILAVNLRHVSGLNDFVELDEPLYALCYFWLMIDGPGREPRLFHRARVEPVLVLSRHRTRCARASRGTLISTLNQRLSRSSLQSFSQLPAQFPATRVRAGSNQPRTRGALLVPAVFVAASGAPCCPYTPEACVERRLSRRGAKIAKTNGSPAGMKKVDHAEQVERSRMRAHLMERLQQGDAEACRLLLDDVGPAVTRFLRARVAIDEVEDVYQETFMAVFQARHTYEPGRPLEPWLFAIARNVAADHSRRRWSRASWEELTADLPERAESESPAAAPDIERLLTRLPRAQREAFAMLKLDGMTLEDAAGRAGVSVGALKVRAHRAYKALRKLIGGEAE